MIKGILFDLDGTLINTNRLILESFKYSLKKECNLDLKDEEIALHFGEPLRKTMEFFAPDKIDILCDTYKKYNMSIHDELAEEYEGVREGLESLKKCNLKIGIVTSKRKEMAERGLKLFNIKDLMDVIITPEHTKKHKPNGEPVLKGCQVLNINPKEVIMVGDSHNDILSGKEAGCITALVKYTQLPMDNVLKYKPDYVIDSLIDLVKIVNENNNKKIDKG